MFTRRSRPPHARAASAAARSHCARRGLGAEGLRLLGHRLGAFRDLVEHGEPRAEPRQQQRRGAAHALAAPRHERRAPAHLEHGLHPYFLPALWS
jgi:hypothetical protein